MGQSYQASRLGSKTQEMGFESADYGHCSTGLLLGGLAESGTLCDIVKMWDRTG